MSIFGLRANYAFLFPNPLWLFTFMYTIMIETKKERRQKSRKLTPNIETYGYVTKFSSYNY